MGFRGRRQRVDGPASFAGTSRIRFRGSVAIATLSAHEALPGGGIRLCTDGTPCVRPARPYGLTGTGARGRAVACSACLDSCPARVPGGSLMRRVFVVLAALALALGLAAPSVLAAQPTFDHTGTLLVAFNGDVTVPTGDSADGVLVTGGTATIHGTVDTVVVL